MFNGDCEQCLMEQKNQCLLYDRPIGMDIKEMCTQDAFNVEKIKKDYQEGRRLRKKNTVIGCGNKKKFSSNS